MKSSPNIGDHIVSPRTLYTHHGLVVAEGRIIHYAGNARPGISGPIEEVSLEAFGGDAGYYIKLHANRTYSRAQSVFRAWSRIGEDGYCVFANNCEHFVEWCISGAHSSPQVESKSGVATGGLTIIGSGAGIGAVSATGAVAGLSAPGIMSGLATVGGVVGGGAVAGLATLAALPGIASTTFVGMVLLKDNGSLDANERSSRLAGRIGAGVGAGAATLGGIGTVSAMGTVAGLSGAGISSGLAAIGTFTGAASVLTTLGVGGGAMAGGLAVTVAAPAVAAAALGYGIYRAVRWAKRG